MNDPTLLLISRDGTLIEEVEYLARDIGRLAVAVMPGLDEAYAYAEWPRVAVVVIHRDGRGPTDDVLRLLRMLAAAKRPVATIILAEDCDDIESSELLRQGATDVLPQPFDKDRLAYLIEVLTLRTRQPQVPGHEGTETDEESAWDEADPMVEQARRVAAQDAPILIHGETGIGKSRLARIIHDASNRRRGPFVTVRCSSIPEDSFEDELFGASYDASPTVRTGGKLGEAREGTLVLDDVDALPPLAQVALLRWLEDEARLSSFHARPRPARPRIIATSRLALVECLSEGRFRSDLYYRLNVIGLDLPPIRQRRLDLPPLVALLLNNLAGRSVNLSPEAFAAIESYSWPGNVRELQEALEQALAKCQDDTIECEHLPEVVRAASLRVALGDDARLSQSSAAGASAVTLAETKRDAEYLRIIQALEKHGNNRLRTACELGISRMTLYKKLYKYGIIEHNSASGQRPLGRPRRPRTSSEPPSGNPAADPSPSERLIKLPNSGTAERTETSTRRIGNPISVLL